MCIECIRQSVWQTPGNIYLYFVTLRGLFLPKKVMFGNPLHLRPLVRTYRLGLKHQIDEKQCSAASEPEGEGCVGLMLAEQFPPRPHGGAVSCFPPLLQLPPNVLCTTVSCFACFLTCLHPTIYYVLLCCHEKTVKV